MGALACTTKPLTCEIWRYLWEERGRLELTSQTLLMCENYVSAWRKLPSTCWKLVEQISKREVKLTFPPFKGTLLNSTKHVSISLSLSEESWVMPFIYYSYTSTTLFRHVWFHHCEPPPDSSIPTPRSSTGCSSTGAQKEGKPGSKFRCSYLQNGQLASFVIILNCIFFNCTIERLLTVMLRGLNRGVEMNKKYLAEREHSLSVPFYWHFFNIVPRSWLLQENELLV